jgi:anti-sigma regulatory factor (Ser/Thr protein kinase)
MHMAAAVPSETDRFRHEAMIYRGTDDFLARAATFVTDGLAAGDAVLVMVEASKLEALRRRLDPGLPVTYCDMAEVGRNPGLIIDAWRRFVDEHEADGRSLRGIGEPVWHGRVPEEVEECQRHERLLNLALPEDPPLWLVCPYDESTLDHDVIAEAHRSHPSVSRDGVRSTSGRYEGPPDGTGVFGGELSDAPEHASSLPFGRGSLGELRRFVSDGAVAAGLDPRRIESLVLAANEIATNSVRHGGGSGVLSLWAVDGAVLCEVTDAGRFAGGPLVGRRPPIVGQSGGHGLWLAQQLCDLVQIRSGPGGTRVRIRMGPTPRV